jgi:arylsulfatase A-like enzyme
VRLWTSGTLIGAALAAAACNPPARPLDLLSSQTALTEARVSGRDRTWVLSQSGRHIRINDVAVRTLPAAPPSHLRYMVDIPKGAHLSVACGIPSEYHDQPGVEFVVKVRSGGREEIAWSLLVSPLEHPEHRRWVHADVDLSRFAGRGREITLETTGYDKRDDPTRAFWGAPALTVGAEAPVAIVYLVDTLRADHTQPYGYARDTTPELLKFASEGVVFEQAIAQASWTKPSVASLLTSLLPGHHRAVQLRDPLDGDLVTLPEMLQAKGYATGAAIANSVIYGSGTQFEQGFDHFAGLHGAEDRPSKLVEAAGVVDEALRFLDSRRGFPTFLYVHTMDPHVPYAPPAPFDTKYEPLSTPDHPGVDPRSDYKEPLDRDRMIARYDGDIAYGDQEFGRFVRELKARGLYDRATIVFIGDHGEEFLDHGKWLHGKSVFDELVHVPLIVKFAKGQSAGQRVKPQVRAVDVLPTVLQALGLPVPGQPAISGVPLQQAITGGAPELPALSEISHRGFVAHGMRTGKDKYVQRFSPEEDELYFDLLKDPKEVTNLLDQNRERVRLLKAGVEAAMVPNPFRHHLKVAGGGEWSLTLRSGGWIENVETAGMGQGERQSLEANGRRLVLKLRPRPGAPREASFLVRPMGAPVVVEAVRDGKPLATLDVFIAKEGVHPPEGPLRLPEIEPVGDDDRERLSTDIFTAPQDEKPGLHLWVTMVPGRRVMGPIDKAQCEALKALGYIGSCPG